MSLRWPFIIFELLKHIFHIHVAATKDELLASLPYPTVVTRADGTKALVVQSYGFGRYMGYVNITYDDEGRIVDASGHSLMLNQSVPEGTVTVPSLLDWYSPVSHTQFHRHHNWDTALEDMLPSESCQHANETKCLAGAFQYCSRAKKTDGVISCSLRRRMMANELVASGLVLHGC